MDRNAAFLTRFEQYMACNKFSLGVALASGLFVLTSLAAAQSPPLADGQPAMQLRLDTRIRYANIDEVGKPKRVDVITARVVAGADIAITPQLRATLEIIHSDYVPPKRFSDDPAAFNSPYPLLPDPRHTGLNEAHITWTPGQDVLARAGRQSLRLGNERHVSDDNFRQVPQLFDGLLLRAAPLPGSQLTLGQFNRLRTRFGSTESMQLTLAELAMNPVRDVSVSAYGIRHRPQATPFDEFRFGVTDVSNWVLGGSVDGSYQFGDVRTYYTLNVADQRGVSGQSQLHARYWRTGLGASLGGWVLRADHEVKGSNGGRYGYQTPLTNQYLFNGNALVFFDTPTTGLRDTWATLSWQGGQWSILGEQHWFRSDSGHQRYGQEFDATMIYTLNPRAHLRAQWARYRPAVGGYGTDINKLWLTINHELK